MTSKSTFSCYVIGETSLTLQCCEKLLERGHSILGILSPNPDIRAWAESRGIPWDEPTGALNGFMRARPCDYLFSIVNNAVLPPEVLALPRRMAINFHDAPLPRYGGIHATSWAIMNREQTHGITWHVMAPKIDAGGVLKQKTLSVSPTDTALSLNMRCYQKALEAFGELVDELAAGGAAEMPQNLSQRTYFARYRRPVRGCMIPWNRTAEEIDAFVRSLDFGPYPNALGVPKICARGNFFIVKKLSALATSSPAAPGTVLAADADGITVATASHDMRLSGLATIQGCACDAVQLARDCGIRPGYRFTEPDAGLADSLTELYNFTCRHEPFWHEQLRGLQPLTLPDMRLHGRGAEPTGEELFLCSCSRSCCGRLCCLCPRQSPGSLWPLSFSPFLPGIREHPRFMWASGRPR